MDGQLASMFTLELREVALGAGGVQHPHLEVRMVTCPTSSSTQSSVPVPVPNHSLKAVALSKVPLISGFVGEQSQRLIPHFYP